MFPAFAGSLSRGSARCLLLAFALVCLPAARSGVRASKESIAGEKDVLLIQQFPETGLDLPASLASDRDVYLIVRAGAAYTDYRVLARPSVPPQRLAAALEAGLQGSPMEGNDVLYDHSEGYSVATNEVDEVAPRLFAHRASNAVPMGRIARELRNAGFTPHSLLWTPIYSTVDGISAPPFQTRNGRWYDGSRLPKAPATVRATITQARVVTAIVWIIWVPILGIGGFLSAILLGRASSVPIKTRRRLYPKFAVWPTFGAIAVHAPFSMWYLRTPALRSLTDLWFGASRPSAVIFPFIMMGPMLMLLMVPLTTMVERRLFGPQEGEEAIPEPVETPEEKAARKRALLWTLLPIAIGFAIIEVKLWVPDDAPYKIFMFPASMLIILFGPRVIRSRFFPQTELMGTSREDGELTGRARRLSAEGGASIKRVEVVGNLYGRRSVFACAASGGRIQVSQRATEVLSPAELDFVLAHEAAHLACGHPQKTRMVLIAFLLAMQVPVAYIAFRHHRLAGSPVLPFLMMGLPLLATGTLLIGMKRLMRTREYQSDRAALTATRDIAAAESALLKLARYSEMPHVHEVEDLSTHPALSKRLAALTEIARELGLSAIDLNA